MKMYICIKTNIGIINIVRLNNSLKNIICPEPIQTNFIEIMNIWLENASLLRKTNNKEHLILEDVDDFKEDYIWELSKRIKICEKNMLFEKKILINDVDKMTLMDLCIYEQNCKRGYHTSLYNHDTGYVGLICVDELMGKCKCSISEFSVFNIVFGFPVTKLPRLNTVLRLSLLVSLLVVLLLGILVGLSIVTLPDEFRVSIYSISFISSLFTIPLQYYYFD